MPVNADGDARGGRCTRDRLQAAAAAERAPERDLARLRGPPGRGIAGQHEWDFVVIRVVAEADGDARRRRGASDREQFASGKRVTEGDLVRLGLSPGRWITGQDQRLAVPVAADGDAVGGGR